MGFGVRGGQGLIEQNRSRIITRVFINFRNGDTEQAAVALDGKLKIAFGSDNVFRSSRSMVAGDAFPEALRRAASECDVLLALIGPHWLVEGEDGKPRIQAPDDWVRAEIEEAMANGRRVIPVLVGDKATLKTETGKPLPLPLSLSALPQLHYLRFQHRSAEEDMWRLVAEIRRAAGPSAPPRVSPAPTAPVMLTTLAPVDQSREVRFGSASIGGHHYGDSIVFRSIPPSSTERGTIGFALRRDYRELEVVAGVLDDAAEAGQTGYFRVVVDGVVRAEIPVRQQEARTLRVDVTDALRLDLVAYRTDSETSPMRQGMLAALGRSSRLPALAWGNPVLHP
ncbi:TIR domain-containing protein [Actinosynnema pretiosum]|uniref:TIR domain-containing protein n=1 Tax=Actinosynnema pretiosum TaxID=42197 RepID=UPI0012FE0050|nr:TIR domain-containing protein [Actinosynnema pretiosum]